VQVGFEPVIENIEWITIIRFVYSISVFDDGYHYARIPARNPMLTKHIANSNSLAFLFSSIRTPL